MEPLTTIELGSCKWLGILAIACTVAGELIALADDTDAHRLSFTKRETQRGNANTRRGRSR
ncbi:MAG: hypothetical protein JOZ13_17325 [Alphaproteobacteria bacterium]|nr:hypothetical protein [Alphaproteobacteria bacterium]